MSLAPGVRIGSYEVLATLGAGGMGAVYRARDARLKREVALKVLPESFANDPDRLARFQREAEVLDALNHPLIAHIYGIEDGPASGDAAAGFSRAIIMELVEGEDLAERLARGALPVDEALPIARQIAEALEAAHEQGIIHRDLKPANIKLRPDGTIKVLDFGLAKAIEASATSAGPGSSGGAILNSPTMTTPAMTLQGMILGTAAYMAPEQAKGHAADKRSDVWAFGCVLFEMLTGRRPFDGEDVADTLALVLKGEPDWNALPAALPPAVVTLLRRCLERDRRRRLSAIATAIFVIDEAGSLAKGVATGGDAADLQPAIDAAVADARRRLLARRVLPAAAVLTLAVALAGAAAWRFSATPPPALIARFALTLPGADRLPSIGRSILAISSDGEQLAYIGGGRLFVRRLADADAREIDVGGSGQGLPSTIHSLAFSPDNRALAFFAGGSVHRIALAGGAAGSLCSIGAPYGLTWDDIGIFAGLGDQGIVRCPARGGPAETVATAEPGEQAHGPQLLPGGTHLLFTVAKTALGPTRWDNAQLVVQPIAGGPRKVVLQNGSDGRYVQTGHLLYALDGVVLAAPFDLDRLEISGESVSVIEGVRRTLAFVTGVAQFATSRTGTLVYVPGPIRTAGDQTLALADRSGAVTRLDVPIGRYQHVRASPDGRRLAVGTDDGSQAIVWMLELPGGGALQRLTQEGRNVLPIWSPDGQRLAFQSDRGGDLGIYAQRIDGTGIERLTKAEEGEAHVPESWSPDGRYLLFSIAKEGGFTLQVLSVATRSVAAFGARESEEPPSATFSPDGKWVAYTVGMSGGRQSPDRGVYVQPFPTTGAVHQLPRVGLDFHPVWAPGGAAIVWVPSAITLRHAASAMSTRTGVSFATPVLFPARVTGRRTSGQSRTYDILPDGRLVGAVDANEPLASTVDQIDSEIRVVLNWFAELTERSPTR